MPLETVAFRPRWFIIFEEGAATEDLAPIWQRNGELLMGMKIGTMATGSFAIKALAFDLESGEIKLEQISWFLEAAAYNRGDNAEFLKEYFAGDKQVKEVAELLQGASERYQEALGKEGIGSEERVAALLLEAASLEEQVGRIFMAKGEILD